MLENLTRVRNEVVEAGASDVSSIHHIDWRVDTNKRIG